MTPLVDRPHTVYRAYDAEGALLYIGCTADFGRRRSQHGYTTPWFPLAARWDLAEYPNFRTARDAERHAIETECSMFNVTPHEQARRTVIGRGQLPRAREVAA